LAFRRRRQARQHVGNQIEFLLAVACQQLARIRLVVLVEREDRMPGFQDWLYRYRIAWNV